MADNFLEKRYSEVFGKPDRTDPETGYDKKGGGNNLQRIIRKYGKRDATKR